MNQETGKGFKLARSAAGINEGWKGRCKLDKWQSSSKYVKWQTGGHCSAGGNGWMADNVNNEQNECHHLAGVAFKTQD